MISPARDKVRFEIRKATRGVRESIRLQHDDVAMLVFKIKLGS